MPGIYACHNTDNNGAALPTVRRITRAAVNLSQSDAGGDDDGTSLDEQLEQLGEQLVAATDPDEINDLAAKYIEVQNTIKSQAGGTDDDGQPDGDEPVTVTPTLGMSARRRLIASLESDMGKLDAKGISQNAPQRSRLKHQLSLARKDLVSFQASRKISASQTPTDDTADDADTVDQTKPLADDTVAITAMRRRLASVQSAMSGLASRGFPITSLKYTQLQQQQQQLTEQIGEALAMNDHQATINPKLLPKEPGTGGVAASHRAAAENSLVRNMEKLAKSRGLVANAESRAEAFRRGR